MATLPKPISNGPSGHDGAVAEDNSLCERAALGDDATQFASANDNAATVADGDDDLLRGGVGPGGHNHRFEPSIPVSTASAIIRSIRSSGRRRD